MREKTQKKAIMDMMKRPIQRKWVGVVTLQWCGREKCCMEQSVLHQR